MKKLLRLIPMLLVLSGCPVSNDTVSVNLHLFDDIILKNQIFLPYESVMSPGRKGYTFVGWSLEPAASPEKPIYDGDLKDVKDLYAVWLPEDFEITSTNNGRPGMRLILHGSFPEGTTFPTRYKGEPITQIEFSEKAKATLTEVTLPPGITSVNESLFRDCWALEKVVLPQTVRSIEDSAFWNCTGLKEISIPDSVTYIGSSAFAHCSSIETIILPNSVKEIHDEAFRNCGSLESVILPSNIAWIPESAFRECTSLKEITIPDPVRFIEEEAFSGCSSLETVTLGTHLTTIESSSFMDCSALSSLTFPKSIRQIQTPFSGCGNLETLFFSSRFPSSLLTESIFDSPPLISIQVPETAIESYRNLFPRYAFLIQAKKETEE